MAASASEGSEALLDQQSEDEWENVPTAAEKEKTSKAACAHWFRLAQRTMKELETARRTRADKAIAQYFAKAPNGNVNPEKLAEEAPSKKKDTTAIHKTGIGAPRPRSTAKPADEWKCQPTDCQHPSKEMLKKGGTHDAKTDKADTWWLCKECGSRWDRLSTSPQDAWIPMSNQVDSNLDFYQDPVSKSTFQFLRPPRCPECKILMMSKQKLIAGMEAWYWGCRNFPKCQVTLTTTEAQAQNQARVTEVSTGQSSRLANPTARARSARSPKRVQRDPNVEKDMDSDE